MKNIVQSGLLALGLTLLSLSAGASAVKAATISYDFEVSNITGPLEGSLLSGSFHFNNEAVVGTGGFFDDLDLYELINFEFDFDAQTFDLESLDAASSGAAFFEDDFVGLEAFDINEQFSIFDDGFGSVFAYDNGFGDISYALQPAPPAQPVPAPSLLLGILGTGVGILCKSRNSALTTKEQLIC